MIFLFVCFQLPLSMNNYAWKVAIIREEKIERNGERMGQSNKITVFQMTLIITTAVGLKNHVIVIPSLLRTGGRDAWIGVIIVAGFTLVWGMLLLYIYREIKGQHINIWLTKNIGKHFTRFLRIIVGIYLVIMIAVTLRETITWTNISYLWKTPPLALTLLFLVPCLLAAMTSLRTLAIANFYILAFVVVFGFFVATANIQFKNYSFLLPILENGMKPVMKSMIYQASGMIELIILILYQQHFHTDLKYRHIVINTIILTGLTLGPLIGAIVEFGPQEATLQRYPAYEEWSLVRVGKFVEHVDYLSIYQWLSGAFIRVTLLLYTIRILLNKKSTKANVWLMICISIFITIVVILPIDDKLFFNFLNGIALPATFFFFFAISILIGFFVFFIRRRKKGGRMHAK